MRTAPAKSQTTSSNLAAVVLAVACARRTPPAADSGPLSSGTPVTAENLTPFLHLLNRAQDVVSSILEDREQSDNCCAQNDARHPP